MPWTQKDAKELLKYYNVKGITPKKLLEGMRVELEHSKEPFDVAHHSRYVTAKIALAHLKENKQYYKLLKQLGL